MRHQPVVAIANEDLGEAHLVVEVDELSARRDVAFRGGRPRNVIESSAVVHIARAGNADVTDEEGTVGEARQEPECTSPFGPSIHAVAGSRYVALP